MCKRVYNNVNILKVITSYLGHDALLKIWPRPNICGNETIRICETWSLGPLKNFRVFPIKLR